MSTRETVGDAEEHTYLYGCFFCQSGLEQTIVSVLNITSPMMETIIPKKTRYRRQGGVQHKEVIRIFPGYIFFRTSDKDCIRKSAMPLMAFRILTYGDNDWQLRGKDLEIAQDLFYANGEIGLSKAYFKNGKIHIVDGFLKRYEDKIVSVNKRSKTVRVRIKLQDEVMNVWLGYELVEVNKSITGGGKQDSPDA